MQDATIANDVGASPRGAWTVLAILVVLAAGIGWFVWRSAHYVTDISPASYSDYFWPRRTGLLFHIAGGATAISTGLVQLWLGFSGRTAALHRTLGRIYLAAVTVGSVGAYYMVFTVPGHLGYSSGLFGLATAWLVTSAMAFVAIRSGNVDQHRAWMLRSYTVTFAFVTFRLVSQLFRSMVNVPADPVASEFDTLLAWGCWAFPLLAMEVLIQWRAMRAKSMSATSAGSFGTVLKADGWKEVVPFVEFRKDRRSIVFDTSAWMELGNDANPRIFDVPVPEQRNEKWTLNLIERLFASEEGKTRPD